MKALRNLARVVTCAALLASAAHVRPVQAEESVWNAWVDPMEQMCYPCAPADVGNPSECPCRIADPIIIKES